MLARFPQVNKGSYSNLCIMRIFSSQALTDAKPSETSIKKTKKPQRPPFIKNIFRGRFDLEMLLYPELSKEGLEELKKKIQPFKTYFDNHVDPHTISTLKMIPQEITENLKKFGLFGQIIPDFYKGRDQSAVETAYISEIVAKDLNIALTLYSHNFLGTQAIVKFGNQKQKESYLDRLASGELIACFCVSEISGSSDLPSLKTKVTPSNDDPDVFTLNGKKQWVTNATNADLFIVVAVSDYETNLGKTIPIIKMCVVERDTPGVKISKPCEHLGLNALRVCEVQFNDVVLKSENFLDADGEFKGVDNYVEIINHGRYNVGAMTISVFKNLLQEVSEIAVNRLQFNKPLAECEGVQQKIEDVALYVYALESMTYHNALVLDQYENADCLLESAIIKVFSFSEGRRCLDMIMEMLGGRAFLTSEKVLKYFNDFRTMETFDGTLDVAKLFISLVGIQHVAKEVHGEVYKSRFPFAFPTHVIKTALFFRRHANNEPKLTLKLFEQIHPSLTESANGLERCVLMMEYVVMRLMSLYGGDIVNQQNELIVLADCAVKIYAMTAVLARASRSYCIGLQEAESELKYAVRLCMQYEPKVIKLLDDVTEGLSVGNEVYLFKLGKQIINHKGYFVEHPLERSY